MNTSTNTVSHLTAGHLQQKLDFFLSNRKPKLSQTNPRNDSTFQLGNIKKDFQNISTLLYDLEHARNLLHDQIHSISDTDWTTKQIEISEKRQTLHYILNKYNHAKTAQKIKKSNMARLKKRRRINTTKTLQKRASDYTLKNRENLHKIIDEWRKQQIADDLLKKKQQTDAERVPQILSGVSKKLLEARKYISLLNSLIELRRVRRIQSGKNDLGEKLFAEKINKLIAVWTDALRDYETEEIDLKKFLSTNNPAAINEWQEALFGVENKDVSKLMRKQNSLEALINIRSAWDSCIVPEDNPLGSHIPLGWVMPNSEPSTSWAVYR